LLSPVSFWFLHDCGKGGRITFKKIFAVGHKCVLNWFAIQTTHLTEPIAENKKIETLPLKETNE